MSSESANRPRRPATTRHRKLAILVCVAIVIIVGYVWLGDSLTLDALAAQEDRLRELRDSNPILSYALAFFVYASVTGLSLPGATVLTLAYGWFFGVLRGVVLVSFASTTGATLAFLLSRYLFRDAIQDRFGSRLKTFNEQLEASGPFYLFTLRLIPAVPFFVINAVMGLTPIRARTFWWVSQLGMFPGTVLYVYAGSSVPSLKSLSEEGIGAVFSPQQLTQLLIAFAMLGVFPLVVRGIVRRLGQLSGATAAASNSSPETRA